MRKNNINEDYLPYNFTALEDTDEFINLCITHLSKDDLNYPLFNIHGAIDITISSSRGHMRFGQVKKKPNTKQFTVGSYGPVKKLIDRYKHNLKEVVMLKFSELDPDDAIFIEYSPTEIKKSFLYTGGYFEQRVFNIKC